MTTNPIDPPDADSRAAQLTTQLQDVITSSARQMDDYHRAAAQLLSDAEPAQPGTVRPLHEEFLAAVRAAKQRRDHTLRLATDLADSFAQLAESRFKADEQAAWDVYRRRVGLSADQPDEPA